NLHPAVIGIADERRTAVWLEVCLDVVAHTLEARPRVGGHLLAVLFEQQVARRKRLEHQAVIGRRLLEVDAVRRDLVEDLRDDEIASDRPPLSAARRLSEQRPEKDQAGA